MESVFIEIDGKLVPFFINEYEDSGSGFIKLSFEGYESSGKMDGYNGCRIFIDAGSRNVKAIPDLTDLTGFRIYSQNDEFIGNVSRIINNPGQLLLQIFSDSDKEILIPLHEDLIMTIDEENKMMKIIIADGLVQVN